jgi:hypothetical protein
VKAAHAAGLTERVRGYCADLGAWAPDVALHGVVCSPSAFAGLTAQDRARVIEVLQSATVDGGVHLVETIAAGADSLADVLPLEELAHRYRGWTISVERSAGSRETFMARKEAVADGGGQEGRSVRGALFRSGQPSRHRLRGRHHGSLPTPDRSRITMTHQSRFVTCQLDTKPVRQRLSYRRKMFTGNNLHESQKVASGVLLIGMMP